MDSASTQRVGAGQTGGYEPAPGNIWIDASINHFGAPMASTDPSQRVALDGSAQDAHESLTRTKQDTSNVDPVVRAAAPQHPEPDDSKRPTSAAAAAPAAAGAAESTSSSSRSASAGLDSKQLGDFNALQIPAPSGFRRLVTLPPGWRRTLMCWPRHWG